MKEEEIELNLELTLGGSLSIEQNPNKLLRSSSISPNSSLARTFSMPVESEKEWRKRKELQNLRRLEAKRRRSEKQSLLKQDCNNSQACSSLQVSEDMPSVYTKGDDPNGRRVDGILYKYGEGEEVRIMCICHGCFYSPAEFIRHAGGTNVDYPLKRIVMNPSASLL